MKDKKLISYPGITPDLISQIYTYPVIDDYILEDIKKQSTVEVFNGMEIPPLYEEVVEPVNEPPTPKVKRSYTRKPKSTTTDKPKRTRKKVANADV